MALDATWGKTLSMYQFLNTVYFSILRDLVAYEPLSSTPVYRQDQGEEALRASYGRLEVIVVLMYFWKLF